MLTEGEKLLVFQNELLIQAVGLVVSRLTVKAQALYALSLKEHGQVSELLSRPKSCLEIPELYNALSDRLGLEAACNELISWKKRGINVVALGQELYPSRLRTIYQPPPLLFYKGDLRTDFEQVCTVAIVGSRRADSYGCDLAHRFGCEVSLRGGCVVSGLALGVDASAHRGALEGGSSTWPTMAVLGNGLADIYPAVHHHLADEILKLSLIHI